MFPRANLLTEQIIHATIEVHRHMGPGLLESIYKWCFVRELKLRGLEVTNQRKVTITYKGSVREDLLRCDLLVESAVLIELKAVEELLPVHKAQLLSYMQLLDVPLGLLINFNRVRLVDGISRLILRGADLSGSVDHSKRAWPAHTVVEERRCNGVTPASASLLRPPVPRIGNDQAGF